jgi:hypothetical protein
MTEMDRRSALACLAAVEVNLGELRGIPTWWKMLGQGQRQEFDEFAATVRAYQHGLQGPGETRMRQSFHRVEKMLDEAMDEDGG